MKNKKNINLENEILDILNARKVPPEEAVKTLTRLIISIIENTAIKKNLEDARAFMNKMKVSTLNYLTTQGWE